VVSGGRPAVLVAAVVGIAVLAGLDVVLTVVTLVTRSPSAGDVMQVGLDAAARVVLLAVWGESWWRRRANRRPVATLLVVLALILGPVVTGFRGPLTGPTVAGVVGEVALVAVLLVLVSRREVRVLWADLPDRSVAEQAWAARRAQRAGLSWWRRARQALIDDRDSRR